MKKPEREEEEMKDTTTNRKRKIETRSVFLGEMIQDAEFEPKIIEL